jgi:hypothetical protein
MVMRTGEPRTILVMFKKIKQGFKWLFSKTPRESEIIVCQHGNQIKVVCDRKVLYEGHIVGMPGEVRKKIRIFKAYQNLETSDIIRLFTP